VKELRDQRSNLKLIASENYSSLATQIAHGTLLTDKYAEGFPFHRFYAGCDNVDAVESEASRLACKLFDADHAFVQPHSGADANLVAFAAVLLARVQEPMLKQFGQTDPSKVTRNEWEQIRAERHKQKLVAMDYYSGGHLTHGYRHNISSHLFDVYSYSVDPDSKQINLDKIRALVKEVRPLILLAGYSAYSRKINFAKMREIADEVGAVFMVDMAHFAGLVAGKVFQGDYEPVDHAHIVTSTTHKTLRGPRGGFVLCKKELADFVDKACPAVLGGPLPHVMAAKALAFQEALGDDFREYAHKLVENCQLLAEECIKLGIPVLTGGTDNHMFLANVAEGFGLTGRQAESALRQCNMTLNRNSLPFDQNGPWYTSGLRIGTAAITTLGMGAAEMKEIAKILSIVLRNTQPALIEAGEKAGTKSLAKFTVDPIIVTEATGRVHSLLKRHLLYPELDTDFLQEVGFKA
jgi:glycine hydroxymethyltransferase